VVNGYLVNGSGQPGDFQHSELLLAAAIIASGVPRQSRSHSKGTLGLGNRVAVVQAGAQVVAELAEWNQPLLPTRMDVKAVAVEVTETLARANRNSRNGKGRRTRKTLRQCFVSNHRTCCVIADSSPEHSEPCSCKLISICLMFCLHVHFPTAD
jgi:hypothetical protein